METNANKQTHLNISNNNPFTFTKEKYLEPAHTKLNQILNTNKRNIQINIDECDDVDVHVIKLKY